jgi:YVTN family beta-propeller protein
VANYSSNTVTELDASTGAIVQTIGVGTSPFGVSSDGAHVWVANYGSDTVTELDASTGAVLQTIGVGNHPIGVSSDGTHAWVTNQFGASGNTVTELDASTGAVLQTIGGVSIPIGVSAKGKNVWVANDGNDTVTELDASTGSIVQSIGISSNPFDPYAISSDGTSVWVTNSNSDTVTELDASTGAVVQTIGVGSYPVGISSDGSHVWVANVDDTVNEIAINFAIVVPNLLPATPGSTYGPVALQAANLGASTSPFVTTLKWKAISLPKGLKLSSAGVLSGMPSKKLAAGPSSLSVQVTETVIKLNAKGKPVKIKTVVQAVIPLAIG